MSRSAEYEEKEFETLANATFVAAQRWKLGAIRIFSPGQVLEAELGFDVATRLNPRSRLFRRLFGQHASAPGVPDVQSVGLPAGGATKLLNLFLQYKRPELISSGHRSKLWPKTEDFLRFSVQANKVGQRRMDQLEVLLALEQHLDGVALVRYASPSVVARQEIYDRFHARTLLATTTFVRPAALSVSGQLHKWWTFQAGDLSFGRPNPDGPSDTSMSGAEFLEHLRAVMDEAPHGVTSGREFLRLSGQKAESALEQLPQEDVSRADMDEDRSDAVQEQLAKEAGIVSAPDLQLVLDVLRVADIARRGGANWTIVEPANGPGSPVDAERRP